MTNKKAQSQLVCTLYSARLGEINIDILKASFKGCLYYPPRLWLLHRARKQKGAFSRQKETRRRQGTDWQQKTSDNTAEEICLLRGGWAIQQADAIPKSIVAAQNNDNLPSVLFRVSSSICLAPEESWADKKFCNFTWWWTPGCRVVWISVNWANRVGWGFQQSVTEATAGRSVF